MYPVLLTSVNEMPTPSRHVELAFYTDDTTIIATSRQLALLVYYMETYLSDIGRCLGEWTIACVWKSTVMFFGKTGRRILKTRPVQFFGQQIHSVDTVRCLEVILDTRLTWSIHIDEVRKKRHRLGVLGPLLNRGNEFCCICSLFELLLTTRTLSGCSTLALMSGNCRYFSPSVYALLPFHLGTV
jgi:hypothetical protein